MFNGKNFARKHNVFSHASKIGDNALALNFSVSGGSWCDKSCEYLNNGCYAEHSQCLYKALKAKLQRHQDNGFLHTLDRAYGIMLQEFTASKRPEFFRFCSHGTIPNRRLEWAEIDVLEKISGLLHKFGIPAHFPVETMGKYNDVFIAGFNPRLSLQHRHDEIRHDIPCSIIVGTKEDTPKDRIEKAKAKAKELRENGHSNIICPSIMAQFMGKKHISCSMCGACANPKINVGIYPHHS